jgi:hypothetical protein
MRSRHSRNANVSPSRAFSIALRDMASLPGHQITPPAPAWPRYGFLRDGPAGLPDFLGCSTIFAAPVYHYGAWLKAPIRVKTVGNFYTS